MRFRLLGVLLIVATCLAVVPPPAATAAGCTDDAPSECCDVDGVFCGCCVAAPRSTLPPPDGPPAVEPAGSLGAEASAFPPGPLPRDILHVPRPAPTR